MLKVWPSLFLLFILKCGRKRWIEGRPIEQRRGDLMIRDILSYPERKPWVWLDNLLLVPQKDQKARASHHTGDSLKRSGYGHLWGDIILSRPALWPPKTDTRSTCKIHSFYPNSKVSAAAVGHWMGSRELGSCLSTLSHTWSSGSGTGLQA